MTAYMIFEAQEISDPETFEQYKAQVFATTQQFGGTYRAIGGQPSTVEGDWVPNYIVIIEFPSRERALEWYGSDVYAPIKALRLSSVVGNGLVLAGLDEDAELGAA